MHRTECNPFTTTWLVLVALVVTTTATSCENALSGQSEVVTDRTDTTDPIAFVPNEMSTAVPAAEVAPGESLPATQNEQTSTPPDTPAPTSTAAAALPAISANGSQAQPPQAAGQNDTKAALPTASADDAADDWGAECEVRHVFRAHGAATPGDATPSEVPPNSEETRQFFFTPPWDREMHLLKSRVVDANTRVVHHWALYTLNDSGIQDGDILDSTDILDLLRIRDANFLVGGGAGSEMDLPDGVGLRLPHDAGAGFLLQLHYFSATSAEVEQDTTGVELCLTSQPQEHVAAAHLLGRFAFELPAHQTTDVQSTCRPSAQREPVHLIALAPHMHETGTRTQVVLNRATGEREQLLDQRWDVDEQRTYLTPAEPSEARPDILIEPGDTLTTTCTYDNVRDTAIQSGKEAEQEMCLVVAWVWPAGVLTNEHALGREFATPEDLDCMEP